MKIEVLKPGVNSTIQDSGRMNGLAFGIPISGAMDKLAYQKGNSILNNPLTNPAIEFNTIGPTLRFDSKCLIAITGGTFKVFINGDPVHLESVIKIEPNDVLEIKNPLKGRIGYVCIKGNIDVPIVWGSKSTYTYASLGGKEGRSLLKGDILNINATSEVISNFDLNNEAFTVNEFFIFPGPEFKDFPKEDIEEIENFEWSINQNSNRMGYLLEGSNLQSTATGNIISSGVIPGTIQVPKSGKPIVLMADSPCTGGYPRIAIMQETSLSRFSQLQPNEKFRLKWDFN